MMTVKTIAFGTVREASFVSSPKAAADSYPAKIKSAERVPLQNPGNEGAVVGNIDSNSLEKTPGNDGFVVL